MRFSQTLKSSNRSLPSPDGALIATILPSTLTIRETRSLQSRRVLSLPAEVAASILWFSWSTSSRRILVASADTIQVLSATDSPCSATITNPSAGTTKVTSVDFGGDDNELVVFLDYGLKVSIINLLTSKSVDISSPKFYTSATAARGCVFRPCTSNLTLLSRSGGKDVISIHARDTLDVVRSWWPDTIDAQGLSWSPDGRWLVIWESASQGHKVVVYTADGHLYRAWQGPVAVSDQDIDATLGAGIKCCEWNSTGANIAIGDYSRKITLLSAPSFTESMSMLHNTAIKPAESLQVWQEVVIPALNGACSREFMPATQVMCPPTTAASQVTNNGEAKSGTSLMSFDNSGSLLATKTEEMPTTMWIWDVGTHILRTVLILHAPIVKATWHPDIDELLLLRCEGEGSRDVIYLWDPSWTGPRTIDFAAQVPGGKVLGKVIARWLRVQGSHHPALFLSDSQDSILASISDSEDSPVPWHESDAMALDIYGQREESPLTLVPAEEKRPFRKVCVDEVMDDSITGMSGGSEEMEDTFQFKKFVPPE